MSFLLPAAAAAQQASILTVDKSEPLANVTPREAAAAQRRRLSRGSD